MKAFVAIEVRSGGLNQDRARHFSGEGRHVLVVADGAGGVGGGSTAAELVLLAAEQYFDRRVATACDALQNADAELFKLGCMSTGVIIEISSGLLSGASAGDSAAWLIGDNEVLELTEAQRQKPLLGDGGISVPFGPIPFRGRLLLASDGLFKYSNRKAVVRAALSADVLASARVLAALPQMASGGYPDDVAVVLVEASV
jgi:PPM family protein phosphatase